VVSGPRGAEPMGLELAELRLLDALRAARESIGLNIRVVGGRTARRHARRVHGQWIPAPPAHSWAAAWHGADLVHLMGLDLPPPKKRPFVAMVHDLSPLHYDDEGTLPPWIEEITQRAALLLTPSAFTASELVRHLSVPRERVFVIGGAPVLEARGAEPLSPTELRDLGVEPPFVLRYGGYTARKNVLLLLEAWARVHSGTLVLVGPPQPSRAKVLAHAPSLDRVVVLDYIPHTLLARLLRSATALVSTSSYEGFGLPPLEALAAGTAVIAVSTPFVREVCGNAACLVENDAESLTYVLNRVFADSELVSQLRAGGCQRAREFTWARTADKLVAAYEVATATPRVLSRVSSRV
jgi:glycosyltransferase involved in cell wall biosynthesis